MGTTLKCSEFFKKDKFSSYSEFFLSMCMARELGRRGLSLDMRDMWIDPDMVTNSYRDYFRYLVGKGYILINTDKEITEQKEPSMLMDVSMYALLLEEGKLLNSERRFNTRYWWDFKFAYESWSAHALTLLNTAKMGNNLMHLVAFWIIRCLLDGETDSITIFIDYYRVKSTFIYVNLYSILGTMPWLKEFFELEVEFNDIQVDLDYSIFCNNGLMMNHNKYWTVQEKMQWMDKLGIVTGSIVILWTRSRINDNNPFGKIENSLLARVDEIGNDFISLSTIAVNKTREEVRRDYYAMEEDCRHLFADILTKKPYIRDETISICDIGIGDYFKSESKFITKIDTMAKASKTITIDGLTKTVEMSEVDALYWLLCQYEIDFNRELFQNMYSPKESLLWDRYADESSYGVVDTQQEF